MAEKCIFPERATDGDSVVLSSRAADRVNDAVAQLKSAHLSEKVWGLAADVSRSREVDQLASFAIEQMGGVDVWINNAASNGATSASRSTLYPLACACPLSCD